MRNFFKYGALAFAGCALLLALAIAMPLPNAPIPDTRKNYALTQVNIVDTINGGLLKNQTVVIEKGVITRILPADEFVGSPSLTVIPASGKYLLPGLWDMHTHSLRISPQLHHPLFIRHGVTGVRDMSGCLSEADRYWACPADRKQWQREAIAGKRIAPRYPLQSSYQTNGGNEVPAGFPAFFRVADATAASQLVDFYARQGADFIKTYSELSLRQFELLALAAAKKNMAIAGHRPLSVSLAQALKAPMASIEHGRLFMLECYAEADRFRALNNPIAHYDARFIRELIDHQIADKCAALMTAMAATDTHWVPTLTTLKMSASSRDTSFRNDPRLAYIPAIVKSVLWMQDINRAASQGNDAAGNFVHGDFFAGVSEQVRRAHAAGVKLMAGTDNIDSYVFTGSSLHDELAMLVEAGLSPLQAIQAATINPARFARLESQFGSVEVGKQADLVLLNQNPLNDIRGTADIHAVIFAGRYFDHTALNKLDHFAKAQAKSLRVNLRYLWDMLASPLMRAQLMD